MTRIQALTRRNAVFGVLILILIAVLIFRPDERSAVGSEKLPALFPDFKPEAARTIVLRRIPKAGEEPAAAGLAEVRLEQRSDDEWVLASKFDFPANMRKAQSFLEAVQAAKRKGITTQNADTFDRYASPEGWIDVDILDTAGRSIARFRLGKTAGWPQSYVQIGEGETASVIRVYNLTPDKARMTLDTWVDVRLWPGVTLPDVDKIDVFQREEQRTLSLALNEAPGEDDGDDGDDGDEPPAEPPAELPAVWRMVAPKEADAETLDVENLIRAFTGMRFDDIVAGSVTESSEADFGLDQPAYRVVVSTAAPEGGGEPTRYTLEVGKRVSEGDEIQSGDPWLVRRGGASRVFEVAAASIFEFQRSPDEFLPAPPEPPEDEGGEDGDDGTDEGGEPPTEATGDPDGPPGEGAGDGEPPAEEGGEPPAPPEPPEDPDPPAPPEDAPEDPEPPDDEPDDPGDG